jgi:hypothetical protein
VSKDGPKHGRRLWPSFETLAALAPQDEGQHQPIAFGSHNEICGNAISSAMMSTSQARNQ